LEFLIVLSVTVRWGRSLWDGRLSDTHCLLQGGWHLLRRRDRGRGCGLLVVGELVLMARNPLCRIWLLGLLGRVDIFVHGRLISGTWQIALVLAGTWTMNGVWNVCEIGALSGGSSHGVWALLLLELLLFRIGLNNSHLIL
jgi:hypothetical protein